MLEWIEEASAEEKEMREILSFQDYFQDLESDPSRELRTSFTYILEMLEFHGKNEDGSYKLFDRDHNESPAVYGQQKVQDTLVHYIKNFKEVYKFFGIKKISFQIKKVSDLVKKSKILLKKRRSKKINIDKLGERTLNLAFFEIKKIINHHENKKTKILGQ